MTARRLSSYHLVGGARWRLFGQADQIGTDVTAARSTLMQLGHGWSFALQSNRNPWPAGSRICSRRARRSHIAPLLTRRRCGNIFWPAHRGDQAMAAARRSSPTTKKN